MTACPINRGNTGGYHAGCRCPECSDAKVESNRRVRARRLQREGFGHIPTEGGAPRPHDYDPAPWTEAAACRGEPTDLFFPPRGEMENVHAAKAICATCTVRAECLAYAQAFGERAGIWGGLTRLERHAEVRDRRRRRSLGTGRAS